MARQAGLEPGCGLNNVHKATRLARVAEACGAPVRRIIIDTRAGAMVGSDENSSVVMGRFISNVRTIAAAGANVAVVHHHGKHGTGRPLKNPVASAAAT